MSNPLVVVLVTAVVVLLRSRVNESAMTRLALSAEPGVHPDYAKERDDTRFARMSADDRAWEVASLQRNRDMTRRADSSSDERI